MGISFGVFRSSPILITALLIGTTAHAQSDNEAAAGRSCADVKPPAVNLADMIGNIPIYLIPPGARGHQATCRATEALAEGMVDVEYIDDAILAEALGDPEPDTTKGKVSEFPYSALGSTPSPGFPPPGPSPERVEDSHLYAAFIDPNTGVEYTFSSVGDSLTDFESAASEWLMSTVEPLLKENASGARAPAAPNLRVHAASNAKLAAVPDAAISAPPYDPLAWDLLVDSTSVMPNVKLARGTVAGKDTELGKSSVLLRIYRLNAGAGANDYFLVDARYTQTPTYAPFSAFPTLVKAWANQRTKFELKARYPRGTFGPSPTLLEFAPRNAISGKSETYTVGADLTASSASVSGSYSVTTTQDSVDTSANATLGEGLLRWNDTYHGFPSDNPPSTSIQTFTGERLAIFTVSRAINDNVPAGKSAGLEFHFSLASEVQAELELLFVKSGYYAAWGSSGDLFAAEPQFSVSTRDVTVSRSKNNVTNPVRVNVFAELPDGAHQVAWKVTNRLTSIAADANVDKGNGEIDLYPTNSMDNGETGGSILVDSSPSGGADSLRNGPIKITVTIEP